MPLLYNLYVQGHYIKGEEVPQWQEIEPAALVAPNEGYPHDQQDHRPPSNPIGIMRPGCAALLAGQISADSMAGVV